MVTFPAISCGIKLCIVPSVIARTEKLILKIIPADVFKNDVEI
jgi:hypothetical protein